MEYHIETEDLSFCYSGNEKVLDKLSLKVPKGSIYGFLGPNGAGKSTTMSLISGLIPEPSQSIKIFNEALDKQLPQAFSKTGTLIESPSIYLYLSGYDNLRYIARLKNIGKDGIPDLLRLVKLEGAANKKTKEYSLGMKQRLAIAMALMDEPELLLLDEPVNGLDPTGIVEIRELLIQINREKGTTIFVSSHLLSEIEKMCTHIGIINNGKLQFQGSMQELLDSTKQVRVRVNLNDAKSQFETLTGSYGAKIKLIDEVTIEVSLDEKDEIPELVKNLVQINSSIYELSILTGVEESFLRITQ